MKVTIEINGKPVDVELTSEQVASIEAQQKPKKFELKYPGDTNYLVEAYRVLKGFSGSDTDWREHGRYRLTEEVATNSLARNKRANRLEALAEQLGGLKEFEFSKKNYYIYLYDNRVWNCATAEDLYYPEIVYMTKECAIEICRMLNEGEVEL